MIQFLIICYLIGLFDIFVLCLYYFIFQYNTWLLINLTFYFYGNELLIKSPFILKIQDAPFFLKNVQNENLNLPQSPPSPHTIMILVEKNNNKATYRRERWGFFMHVGLYVFGQYFPPALNVTKIRDLNGGNLSSLTETSMYSPKYRETLGSILKRFPWVWKWGFFTTYSTSLPLTRPKILTLMYLIWGAKLIRRH